MKKLLSILSVISISVVTTSASSFVVYHLTKKHVNISEKKFQNIENNKIKTVKDLFKNILTQMASWANTNVKYIRYDENIKILIENYAGETLNTDKNNNINAGYYTINIKINSKDPYFIEQDETNYNIAVNLSDISQNKFGDIKLNDVKTGADLLENIQNQMSYWTIINTTWEDIANDKNILIVLKDSKGNIINPDTNTKISIQNYIINIKITNKDPYFIEQDETKYNISVN